MDISNINKFLSEDTPVSQLNLPHIERLQSMPIVFEAEFGLKELPEEPGVLLVRGARQYGKSTWLEQQLLQSFQQFGPGTSFYLNGDYIKDAEEFSEKLITLGASFTKSAKVKRIFIDEITTISGWEIILKRVIDSGLMKGVLFITTGSKATDLRRGAERLPGRKGKLDKTNYFFTPLSYRHFYEACHKKLKSKTLSAYLLSGGSPIACAELATNGYIPEYVIQLVRDWVEGEISASGRQRSGLMNVIDVLFRFGGNAVGQAKLAREAGLANNTVAQGYIEVLSDLGCVIAAYPINTNDKKLILRKPCKFHFTNLLVATAYHPSQPRSPEDFTDFSPEEQGKWMEWLVAQELQRRHAIKANVILEPLAFWQSKQHEIDFFSLSEGFIEVKRGQASPLEFAWFSQQFSQSQLKVISNKSFSTNYVEGLSLENFMLEENYTHRQ